MSTLSPIYETQLAAGAVLLSDMQPHEASETEYTILPCACQITATDI